MKRAVSISLGSSTRDKKVEVELLGEKISIERIGTDGDMERAANLYKEMDGSVDAFGVGGADLGLLVDGKWYTLHSVKPMVRHVRQTPLVDGTGLKTTLEHRAAATLESHAGDEIKPKRALLTLGIDRWGMTMGFIEAGYDCAFGDLMFGLGIPIALRSVKGIKRAAAMLMPIAGRLPFEMVYPTGEKQETHEPKYGKWFEWATVYAGDCHYVKRHMPAVAQGKTVVTNTTTDADVELFRKRGIKYLVTTTPVLEGRSFGTNMMEAALVAVAGKGRVLTHAEYDELLGKLGFEPEITKLN